MFTASQQAWAAEQVGQSAVTFPPSQAGMVRRVFDVGNGRAVILASAPDGPIVWSTNVPTPTPDEHAAGGSLESVADIATRDRLIEAERARVAGELDAAAQMVTELLTDRFSFVAPTPVEAPANDPATVEATVTETPTPA